jgi:hypothetical protein
MANDDKVMRDFICFSAKETMSNLQKSQNDPSFKVIEEIATKYGVNKEGAWSLYRPIFWYLCNQKIISVDNTVWRLHPEYHHCSEDKLDELINGVVYSYHGTLNARLEKYHNNK